jgi:hypothetical protein
MPEYLANADAARGGERVAVLSGPVVVAAAGRNDKQALGAAEGVVQSLGSVEIAVPDLNASLAEMRNLRGIADADREECIRRDSQELGCNLAAKPAAGSGNDYSRPFLVHETLPFTCV